MSFKLNDYNAFLTSLFDKNNSSTATTPATKIQMDSNQSPFSQKQGTFPVDFDFGLIANSYGKTNQYSPKLDDELEETTTLTTSNDNSTNNTNNTTNNFMINDLSQPGPNSNSNMNSVSPIILESDLSIPDQQFDLYNVNFNPQPMDSLNNNTSFKNQPLSPLSNIYEEFDPSVNPTTKKVLLKKIKSNDAAFVKQEFDSFDLNKEGPAGAKNRPRVKSAHNIIEQRYRNKINDKFTALQMSVPSLRVATRRKKKSLTDGDDDDDDESIFEFSPNSKLDSAEDLEGLEPARKLNKGTILTKSIEYIKFLELKNSKMKQEHEELVMKAKLLGIEIDSDLLDN